VDTAAILARGEVDKHKIEGVTLGESEFILQHYSKAPYVTIQDSIKFFSYPNWDIYLIVLVKYYDMFNIEHYTWTCVYWSKDVDNVIAYPKYNDAD
jgi:hypothetical protein